MLPRPPALPHPRDVIASLRTDIEDGFTHYHVFTQIVRFASVWAVAFLGLSARGTVDGWNALFATAGAAFWTAVRQYAPTVDIQLIRNILNEAEDVFTHGALLKPHPMTGAPMTIARLAASLQAPTDTTFRPPANGAPISMSNPPTVVSPTLAVPIAPPDPSTPVAAANGSPNAGN